MSLRPLMSAELSLVEHVSRGEQLDLAAAGEAVDEAAMRSWGESRTCRASVIRDILRGRLAADPDPHGLRLRGAKITGRLDLQNLTTDVHLDLQCCLLEQGVCVRDAHVASLTLTGCQIEHPAEPALDGARVTCTLLDLTKARIIGHAQNGAVNLRGARIGSYLDCSGAELRNDSGPALAADSLQVNNIFLQDGFTATATGTGGDGAVNLSGAHIGSHLIFEGAGELRNDSGPALYAGNLQVDQDMYLRDRFTATGTGDDGAVLLAAARIGGNLDCRGAKLRNDSGPALAASGLQVGQAMTLDEGFAATGGNGGTALDLTDARMGGGFWFGQARLVHKEDSQRLQVDGLTYVGVPESISAQGWRDLLRHGTPYYAAQPYQQLAAGCRALGDDREARETLIAQRDDQLARTHPGPLDRLWGRITKVTLGYGYKPGRALWFLAAIVAMSCVFAVVLGSHGALAQTSTTATPGRSCTLVQQLNVGLDLILPVTASVGQANCDLTTDSASATASWLTVAGWVLRLLAWGFAVLFVAGFTSAVRKT
jgi:hypothetical protein